MVYPSSGIKQSLARLALLFIFAYGVGDLTNRVIDTAFYEDIRECKTPKRENEEENQQENPEETQKTDKNKKTIKEN